MPPAIFRSGLRNRFRPDSCGGDSGLFPVHTLVYAFPSNAVTRIYTLDIYVAAFISLTTLYAKISISLHFKHTHFIPTLCASR